MVSDIIEQSGYKTLKEQLETLGYNQEFSADSVNLIRALVGDLLQTTDSLKHFQKLARDALQVCRDLEISLDKHRSDNVKINNELERLHESCLQHNKICKKAFEGPTEATDARYHGLKKGLSECDVNRIKENLSDGCNKCHRKEPNNNYEKNSGLLNENQNLREKCAHLLKLLKDKENMVQQCCKFKNKQNDMNADLICDHQVHHDSHMNDCIGELKSRLLSTIKELKEAKHNAVKLEEKCRELEQLNKNYNRRSDICRKHTSESGEICDDDKKIRNIEEEVTKLKSQYEKLVSKEKEKCSSSLVAVNTNSESYKYVQEIVDLKSEYRKLDKNKFEIETEFKNLKEVYENIKVTNAELEKDLLELKRSYQELEADKDKLIKRLSRLLEENKISTDKMNKFKVIERDMTLEIGRLNSILALQRKHIADLEQKIIEMDPTKDLATKNKLPGSTLTIRKKPLDTRFKTGKNITYKEPASNYLSEHKKKLTNGVEPCVVEKTPAEKMVFNLKSKYEREMCNLERRRIEYIKKSSNVQIDEKSNIDVAETININKESNLLTAEIEILKKEIDLYKKECSIFEDQNRDLSRKNENLIKMLEEKNKEIDRLIMNRHRILNTYNDTNFECSSTQENIVHQKCGNCLKLEKALTECDNRVCKLETDNKNFVNKHRELLATIECNNEQIFKLQNDLKTLEGELQERRIDSRQLKLLQEESKSNMKSSNSTRMQAQLETSQKKVKELEIEKTALQKEIYSLKAEQKSLQRNLRNIDGRKNTLLLTVDEKTERLITLEKLLDHKESHIRKLEHTNLEMQKKFDLSKLENKKNDETVKKMTRDLELFKKCYKDIEKNRDKIIIDNKRLQNDLASLTREYAVCRSDLEKMNKEVQDLRTQMHDYIEKVRSAEETLQQKDSERSEMLQHFRMLTVEATHLESNNHTLESEARSTRSSLRNAENKIVDLELIIRNKDTLIRGYEEQLSSLTQDMARLETKIKNLTEERDQLELDLTSCRELCNQMDDHRDSLSHSVSSLNNTKQQLEDKCISMEREVEYLKEQLTSERVKISTIEQTLADVKIENSERLRIITELKKEITDLKANVKCLEKSLEISNRKIRLYNLEATDVGRRSPEELYGRSNSPEFELRKTPSEYYNR